MSKIMIISDIHINDYESYEFKRFQRLNNYILYAKRIVELAEQEGCNDLFILGDILDKPTNRPYIQRVLNRVFKIFSKGFNEVYYILGQHDVDSKSEEFSDESSVIFDYAPDNFHYMNHRELYYGKRKIAFQNYSPDQDLSWLDHKVDVLCGHITIMENFGQELDESKFDLCIAGDIHMPMDIGKMHSVGISLQRFMTDACDGTYVILDTGSLKFERKLIDPDQELFTKYIYTDNPLQEGFSKELTSKSRVPKEYRIYRPTTLFDNAESIEFDSSNLTTINEVISELVKAHNLTEIHQEILSKAEIRNPINLNFELLELTIQNIRSIDEVTIDFRDKSGTYLISSENGGGKSTIINSLKFALCGGFYARDEMREGADWSGVTVKLFYDNKLYQISRFNDSVEFYIDGTYQEYSNKRAAEQGIYDALPFIDYIDSFFFQDDAVNILSDYDPVRRIELLSTYYRLDVIESYRSKAEDLLQNIAAEYDELEKSRDSSKSKLEEKKSLLKSYSEKLKELLNGESLDKVLKEESKLLKSQKNLIVQKNNLNKYNIESLIRSKRNLEMDLTDQKGKLNSAKRQSEVELVEVTELDPTGEKLKRLLKLKSQIDKEHTQLKSDIRLYDRILQTKSKLVCPNCSTEIEYSDGQVINVKETEELKSKAKKRISCIDYRLESLDDLIDKLENNADQVSKYTQKKKSKENALKLVESYQTAIDSIELSLNQYQESIDEYNKALEEYSEEEEQRVSKALTRINSIKTIHESLSDPQLKSQIDELSSEVTDYEAKLLISEQSYNKYKAYCDLMSPNGDTYKEILNHILSKFNSEMFKYEVVTSTYRGKEYNDFIGYFKDPKMKNYRVYSSLSRGQKTLVDLDFVRNLIQTKGLVVFDEILKFLTTTRQDLGLRIIKEMNPKLKIVTTQGDNANYVDHKLFLEYDGSITHFKGL